MNWLLIGILVYVVAQIGIGLYVARRNKSEEDYLLAGRSLGMGMVTMTVFATWFGAETCIGASGEIYAHGLSGGRLDPFGYSLCIIFLGLFFAASLWRRKLTTLGDLFRQRYGPVVERIAVLIMIPTSLLWAAAQVRAFGQVLSVTTGFNVEMAITIAATVVILYTIMGGMLADAMSDYIQGIVLVAGLFVLFIAVLLNWPEPELVSAALSEERLRFRPEGEAWLISLETWAIPIIGSLFAQELVARTLAARSAQISRNACLTAGGIYILVGLIPVSLGVLGPAILPNLADPEQFLPTLAQTYLPPLLFMLFAGALISAILSTVDSALLAASGLVSHNLLSPLWEQPSEKLKVRLARCSVFCLGVTAYLLAITGESVYHLVETASSFGTAGLFTAAFFAFFPKWGGKWSATAALLAGISSYILFAHVLGEERVATPYIFSVACAIGAFCSVMLFEKGASPEEEKASQVPLTDEA